MGLAPWWQAEISRKVLHVASAATPLVYCLVSRDTMLLMLVACVASAVAVEVLRQSSAGFRELFRRYLGFMVRAAEWNRITGATYVLVGALLVVWLFPKPIAIAAMFIQSISDSAASLIGLRFGRARFFGKSLAGSLAFFFTAVVILWIARPEAKGAGLVAGAVATCTEAMPALRLGRFELNDNLTIPLLAATTMWLFHVCGVA